jgi:cytochrome c oxidase cbb3-type subunit 2
MYDHPFQWGSKRTGPDLARVGGRYSDEWHVDHLIDPQSVVPESVMPSYAFSPTREIDGDIHRRPDVDHRMVGVPYTDEMIAERTVRLVAAGDRFRTTVAWRTLSRRAAAGLRRQPRR